MKKSLCIFFLLVAFTVGAQDTLKVHELEEVTVTGEIEPQSIQNSVYNVRTIPLERLQAQGATRLQDVLTSELNIRFSQDLALGGSNITMVGLSGQNVKILIDGVPMIGRQGTSNEININQINITMIERIEIIEGPMSVIYGPDALGGVINIITKKGGTSMLTLNAGVHEESVGKAYGRSRGIHDQHIDVVYKRNAFYLNGNVARNDFKGWVGDSTGREYTWHPKRQWLGGGVIGFQRANVHAYYRFDALDEKIYNPGAYSGIEAIDQNYITKRLMHQFQASGDLSENVHYATSFAYTDFDRRTQSVVVNKDTGKETLANAAMQSEDNFDGLSFRGSVQYDVSKAIRLLPGIDVNSETGRGARLQTGDNTITDYAAYVVTDLKVANWNFRPGVRMARNSAYEAPPFIPSVNAKVSIGDRHDVRFGYGRGFRAPSIRELYFSFFDASHAITGNPNLSAERSHSFNLSWNANIPLLNQWWLKTSVATFYNDIDNLIDYGVIAGSQNTTYINVSEFRSKGITLNATFRKNDIELRFGYAQTGRYNVMQKLESGLPEFTWSPEVNASVAYPFSKTFMISMFYKYTGKTKGYVIDPADNTVALARTGSFHWADLTLRNEFSRSFSLTGGVRNIFNVTTISNSSPANGSAHNSAGARPVGYGRSFFLSLNFKFHQNITTK